MFAAPPRYCLTSMTDCGVNFLNTSNIIFVAVHRVTRDSLPTISLVTLLESGTLLRAGQGFIYVMSGLRTALMFAVPPRCALTSCTTMQIMA